jgi:hypothetical protein
MTPSTRNEALALLTAPVLSRPQMRVLTRVLTYDNCTPLVAARVDAALRLLAVVPANRSVLRAQLGATSARLSRAVTRELMRLCMSSLHFASSFL